MPVQLPAGFWRALAWSAFLSVGLNLKLQVSLASTSAEVGPAWAVVMVCCAVLGSLLLGSLLLGLWCWLRGWAAGQPR